MDDDDLGRETIGGRIRAARKAAGLTAEELGSRAAAILGRRKPLSASAVRNQENGTNGVPLVVLHAYAEVLKLDVAELLVNGPSLESSPLKARKQAGMSDQDVGRELDASDLAIQIFTTVTGNWELPTLQEDEVFGDRNLLIDIPGLNSEALTAHYVPDNSLSPIYPKGTFLITAPMGEVWAVNGDHVIAYRRAAEDPHGKYALRELYRSKTGVSLRALGASQDSPIPLLDHRGFPVPDPDYHVLVESLVVAIFRVNTPAGGRARLFLPESVMVSHYEPTEGEQEDAVDPSQTTE